ncbi:hypothetical protein ACOMHN_029040 [Nucella lapillus]
MSFLHHLSAESVQSGLDLFSLPPSQTSIEDGQYVEVYPLATLSPGAPIEFIITGGTSELTDLSNTYLHVQVKITNADGTDLAADHPVAPVNNFLHTLFSQVDVSLNGVLVTNSENTYPYRAMLETLLTYGPDAQKCGYLECCLFSPDTAAHMDSTAGDNNRGLRDRRQAAAQSRIMDLMGRLHTDLMAQERYLLNGVDVKFRLTPSKNSFCLMEDGANQGCRAEITHCSLFVRKAKVNPAITLGHAKALEKGTAKYPVKRVVIKSLTVPVGNVSAAQDNLFLSQTPNRIVVALVDSSAVNGQYDKNPFHFQNFDLNFLDITLDGKHVPAKPLTPDFDRKRVTRAYLTTLEGSGLLHKDAAAGFSLDRFTKGYALFCFDLTPSLVDGDQFELVKSAPMRLELKFAKALPNPVVVLIYGELDGLIEVNKSRQVLTDFAV